MVNLSQQRCFNHAGREAVARCPECGRFFCRECITEHEARVLCASCLKKVLSPPLLRRPAFLVTGRSLQFLLGLLTLWFFFYVFGQMLLSIDTSIHEGTVWTEQWLNPE